jgi:hypothetical protein
MLMQIIILQAGRMTMDVRRDTQKVAGPQECAGCGKKITER